MHTLGLGNLFDAFAKNDVSIDPAALDLRQRVEGVPKTDKSLLELQHFLGSGLVQAGGVFDPIVTIQGIICLVVAYQFRMSGLTPLAGHELLGHLVRHLHQLVRYVPIIKIFQIDSCH